MYDLKTEAKIHKIMDKGNFREAMDTYTEAQVLKMKPRVMSPDNVYMIVAKSDRAKLIIRRYLDKGDEGQKEPNLRYKEIGKAKYGMDYLMWTMDLLKASDTDTDSVWLQTAKDFPMTAENDDFKIIIAPRVDSD